MDNTRMEEAQRIVDKLSENLNLSQIEDMIKDNKIIFELEGITYRVRLLKVRENEELYQLKTKKFHSMLQEKDSSGNHVYLTEKDLFKVYRERGIDIEDLEDSIKQASVEITNLSISLGEALSKQESIDILHNYRDRINELSRKRDILLVQKNDLLKTSIENQLLNYEAEVITYLTLEILDNNNWVRKFSSYEDFMKCEDDELINKAGTYTMLLQYR